MTDDDTRKINTEADDADVTVVLSTQELASRIEPDAHARHADDARAVTATARPLSSSSTSRTKPMRQPSLTLITSFLPSSSTVNKKTTS